MNKERFKREQILDNCRDQANDALREAINCIPYHLHDSVRAYILTNKDIHQTWAFFAHVGVFGRLETQDRQIDGVLLDVYERGEGLSGPPSYSPVDFIFWLFRLKIKMTIRSAWPVKIGHKVTALIVLESNKRIPKHEYELFFQRIINARQILEPLISSFTQLEQTTSKS